MPRKQSSEQPRAMELNEAKEPNGCEALNARIGNTGLPLEYTAKLWASALMGAAAAWAVKIAFPVAQPIAAAVVILGPYGLVFFAMTAALRIPEGSAAIARLTRLR